MIAVSNPIKYITEVFEVL